MNTVQYLVVNKSKNLIAKASAYKELTGDGWQCLGKYTQGTPKDLNVLEQDHKAYLGLGFAEFNVVADKAVKQSSSQGKKDTKKKVTATVESNDFASIDHETIIKLLAKKLGQHVEYYHGPGETKFKLDNCTVTVTI
jgi:hypothetical protein